MKFKLKRTWGKNLKVYDEEFENFNVVIPENENDDAYIEISSMEELIKFVEAIDERIIISRIINYKTFESKGYVLEIYDDYRE